MPHRTSLDQEAPSRCGPWLVSLVMWANFMQFLGEEGASVRELEDLTRIANLGGMERWRYVDVKPDPTDRRPEPPRRDWLIRPSAAGRLAQQVWRPLAAVIEERWWARFGEDEVGRLTASLHALVRQFDVELPRYLPVVTYGNGMLAPVPKPGRRPLPAGHDGVATELDLSVLLSQVLLAFTLEFERESDLSFAISGNALRILDDKGVAVRDLPRLTGVSKEAISASVGFLRRHGYAVVEPDPAGGRAKLARLTAKGQQAQDAYRRLLGIIEERWQERFGTDTIRALRSEERRVGKECRSRWSTYH